MKIILASQSERRKELLDLMGLKYEIKVSNSEEKLDSRLTIEAQSKKIAYMKAKNIFDETEGDRLVIASDTMVIKNGKLFGKPKDEEDAMKMIEILQGSEHQVITSLCVLVKKDKKYKEYVDYDVANVYIKKMDKQEIERWVRENKVLDKAGAYAIQSRFAVYVEKIEGNYFTVVGLPVHKLYDILKEISLDVI